MRGQNEEAGEGSALNRGRAPLPLRRRKELAALQRDLVDMGGLWSSGHVTSFSGVLVAE